MQYFYKDKDNKIINKKFAGFSTYLSVNKSEEPVIDYFSMDADIIFRCDTLNCKHREKCKNSQISADKMAKKCPYIKKINKLFKEYSKGKSYSINYTDFCYLMFGDIKDLPQERADETVVCIEHNCKDCKKHDTCEKLAITSKNPICPLNEELFALSSLGVNGIAIWDENHTECKQVLHGECAKNFLELKEKQR